MTQQRHLLAQGQRRVLGIQSKASVYRGKVPAEPGTAIEPSTPLEPPTPPAQQFGGTLTATELEEFKPWLLAVSLGSNGNADLAGGYLAADVVKIHDSDDSHELSFVWNEAESSANRTLNLIMGGANRTVTFSGNPTLADWFNQAVKIASSPTHVNLTLTGSLTTKGLKPTLVTKTGNYTATATDYTILCNATGGSFTITLPAAASHTDRIYNIKKIDSSANTITVDGNASETIDDATTAVLTTQYESITIQSDGSEWWII